METKYGTNDNGEALVNAIPHKHTGYVEITKTEWESLVEGINNPTKTFDQELDYLNLNYETDLKLLVEEHNLARARNTDNESSKVMAAQAKITALDSWYSTEFDTLIIKHF